MRPKPNGENSINYRINMPSWNHLESIFKFVYICIYIYLCVLPEAYASFWSKDPPARVAVQVAALAGNASAPRHRRQLARFLPGAALLCFVCTWIILDHHVFLAKVEIQCNAALNDKNRSTVTVGNPEVERIDAKIQSMSRWMMLDVEVQSLPDPSAKGRRRFSSKFWSICSREASHYPGQPKWMAWCT